MEAYDAKYAQEGFRNSETYYRWVLEALAPQPGQRLLDVGCGLGYLLERAVASGLDVVGVDLSPRAASACQFRVPSAKVLVADGQRLPFPDETFDIVTILGSLEHYIDPGQGLLEIRRVLRPGGRVAIVVPNGFYLPDLVWQVWRKGLGPNHKQIIERFAAVNEWRGFIESGGLAVRKVRRFNFQWPRNRDDLAWYRANPRRWLGLLAAPLIPFNLSHSFLYLCEKEPTTRDEAFSPPHWPAPPRLVDLATDEMLRRR